ncbi:MAG: penicillin acylase family protein, partial [Anaerolineae bacterium]|nr:penicillin acylase family protein [Anaerolineae bacterium]
YDQLAAELGADSSYLLSYFTAYGYRAQRINDWLPQNVPHTWETFAALQGDNLNLSAGEMLPYVADLDFADAVLSEGRDWLLAWDLQMHMDSPQAALYGFFWLHLMDALYNDQLAPVLRASGNDNMLWATYLLVQDPENPWWDDTRTADMIETRDDILKRAFSEGYAAAVDALGEDRAGWRWGAVHTATFISDPVGRSGVALAEALVNRGPVAVSGGSEIVNATGWDLSAGNFDVRAVPSMRIILDLSDWGNSRAINSTGQSGNPLSLHYDDMINPWRTIAYHPLPWTRSQVEAAAVERLVLNPVE